MAKDRETGNEPAKPARQHKATYSRDNREGGWLVRIVGPSANKFANRDVPVTRNDGSENVETLGKLITSGVDEGNVIAADKGKNYALYKFQPKERVETEAEF